MTQSPSFFLCRFGSSLLLLRLWEPFCWAAVFFCQAFLLVESFGEQHFLFCPETGAGPDGLLCFGSWSPEPSLPSALAALCFCVCVLFSHTRPILSPPPYSPLPPFVHASVCTSQLVAWRLGRSFSFFLFFFLFFSFFFVEREAALRKALFMVRFPGLRSNSERGLQLCSSALLHVHPCLW